MSIEHDNLPVNPRLDALLRQIVTANDLQPEQNQRVRARLGLHPHQTTDRPTASLPASRHGSLSSPVTEQEGIPMIATTRARLRQQWLQFALAAVAFIAAGVVLALIFGSGGDDPETQPGVGGSPEATATVAPATATIGSQDPSALPTPDETGTYRGITFEQARQIVPFEIVTPERVPEGLEPPELTAVELRRPVPPGARDYQVEMVYEVSGDESPPKSVAFTQLGPSSGELNLAETESTTTTTINGVEVTRIAGRSTGGDPLLAYTWERDDLHYMIFTALDDDLTPELVEALMQAILATADHEPSALPTPDDMGSYRGITLELAQEIVPFEIVMPERVPDGLEPPTITVIDFGPLATGGRRYHVQVFFEVSGSESPRKSVLFLQVSPASNAPNMPGAETTTTTIGGVEVNRTTGVNAGGEPLLAYWWTNNDIGFQIMSNPEGDLTPGLVENLMQAILVPAGPTTEEQSAILEQERAEMMSAPVPDWCQVSPWAGPDFRVRRSDAAAYFIDGDGLTLGTTHGVLFAGENEITWLADAPLTTEEALAGPRSIMAGRSDSRIVGDPVPVEIPIEVTQQIERGIIPDDVERGWWSTVSFPEEGCWEIEVTLGPHILMATVYVFPAPAESGITFDEARVQQIALADPRVQALLAAHPYQVSEIGTWTGEGLSLIGGVISIAVNGPRNIAGEWFEHSWLDCETQPLPDPVVVSYRAEYAGVTEVHVLIDLSAEAVAAILPFGDDGISLVGSREFTGEYVEVRTCSQD